MTPEIVVASSSLVVAVVAVGGVIATWRKNGKDMAARDQEIKDNQAHIIKKLDDQETGLPGLNRRFQNFEVNCAGTKSSFDQRILAAERDIKELKQKTN